MVLAVIGAGMVGCVTALALKNRGHDVVVYERRSDPRKAASKEVGRSINLAISSRGLKSLRAVDPSLCDKVESMIVPMRGRMVHSKDSIMTPVPYGISGTESINSIGRADLNNILINAVEKAQIEIKFDTTAPASLEELTKLGKTVFGCDGTYSKVRDVITKNVDYKLEMETVPTYYMEVPIQEAKNWKPNYLHVWPRGSHMFIALPNADGTFTGTLFAPKEIFDSELKTDDGFVKWFSKEFGDATKVVGEDALRHISANASRGKLTSLKFEPYHLGGSIVLLGDAAHSMVPFYGQGLNAGLEDVSVLFEKFIDAKYPDPKMWHRAFDEYSKYRKVDCDAINNLSMSNYKEMSTSVATTAFKVRKFLDNQLSHLLGDHWLPLYTMISFRDDIRYSAALTASRWQQQVIDIAMYTIGGSGIVAFMFTILKLAHKIRRKN